MEKTASRLPQASLAGSLAGIAWLLLLTPGQGMAAEPAEALAGCTAVSPAMALARPAAVQKSEAILGGKRSKLDEMRAQQTRAARIDIDQTTAVPIPSAGGRGDGFVIRLRKTATAGSAALLPATAGASESMQGQPFILQPWAQAAFAPPRVQFASLTLPNLPFSVKESSPAPIPSQAASPCLAALPDTAEKPFLDRGQPDVFGSVAIAVTRTPLDDRWAKVRGTRIAADAGPWSGMMRTARTMERSAQIVAVNSWVNRRIGFIEDRDQFGVPDRWLGATQSLQRGRGDCEDYAIAKMQLLAALGIAQQDMYLVIARDLVRRADHAVLVVRDGNRLVLLDNSTDQVLDAHQARDYRPIMSYSGNRAWLHGYRKQPDAAPATIQMAAL